MVNHSSMPIHSPIFFGLKMRPTRKIRSMRTARVVLAGLLHSGLTWEICPFSFAKLVKIAKLFCYIHMSG